MRLLLVEDDPLIGDGLQAGLSQLGYTVDWLKDGPSAAMALASDSFDLVVLDLGLPGRDGMSVLDEFRRSGGTSPVLILTARDAVEDRIAGLDAGADDYLVKPFSLDELAARLRAIGRRQGGRASPELVHGEISLDPATRKVTRAGEAVELTAREFAILELLLSRPGEAFSRDRLEEALYGWDEGVESNALEVYIHHLRKKLGKELIRTLRGVGYMIPRLP